jgi:hypothetical protein
MILSILNDIQEHIQVINKKLFDLFHIEFFKVFARLNVMNVIKLLLNVVVLNLINEKFMD